MKSLEKISYYALTFLVLAIGLSRDGWAQNGSASLLSSDGLPAWAFLWDPTVQVPPPDDKPNDPCGTDGQLRISKAGRWIDPASLSSAPSASSRYRKVDGGDAARRSQGVFPVLQVGEISSRNLATLLCSSPVRLRDRLAPKHSELDRREP